jgi:hypothetical protein
VGILKSGSLGEEGRVKGNVSITLKRKERHSQIINVYGDAEMDRIIIVQEVVDCERRPQN